MDNMIYTTKEGDIDLSRVTRLYPAVMAELDGDVAEMSLEWTEIYGEKVKLHGYILVFDFSPVHAEKKERKILEFATKDELIAAMQEVARFFQE